MRYYAIRVLSPETETVLTFDYTTNTFMPTPGAFNTWASHDAQGILMPGALNVELDVPSLPYGAFQGNMHLRIWGVGLPALAQAANLAGMDIEIIAGMKSPYVLNIAALAGQIAYGSVFQCYGNWEGLNQYLDLIIVNAVATPNATANISFNWKQGTTIGSAITTALNAAFPTYEVLGADLIKPIINSSQDEQAHYPSIQAFASWVADRTADGTYTGVQIVASGSDIYLYDNLLPQAAVPILFQDMIGQPTWISATNITFACVMRADIQVGDLVTLPAGLSPPYVLTTPEAALPGAPASNKLAFQGSFYVIEVHHYGNFRQNDAESWRTVYVAAISGL